MIRRMRLKDERAVLALATLCHPGEPAKAARWYSHEHRTLVYERDGAIIGYTTYGMTPDHHAFGRDVGVHPDWRGKGIGGELHGHRLIEAKERGAVAFVGITPASNPSMVKILEGWGGLKTIATAEGDCYVNTLGEEV